MWGNNTFGLLGDNRALTTYYSWTSISSGGSHTSAIRSDGTLWAWGFNVAGQLGDGTTTNKSSPVQVGYSSWVSVSSGGYHTIALDKNYVLYTWGLNSSGQLGDGTTVNKSYPSLVYLNNISFTSVSAGAYHSLALTTANVLYSWGDNESGQLGTSSSIYRSSPVQIGSYTQIDAGKFHSGAIDSLGKLYTWGANPYSQLGQSDTVYRSSPTQLGTSSWTMIAGGGGHTLAIDSNNKLFAWGSNIYGQVGNNPTYSGNYWTTIANGPNHMLALRNDGILFARGLNTSGQLGDGTTVNRSSIVQIGSGSWSIISVGASHSVALSSNGTLWSWGDNSSGQLNQQNVNTTYPTSTVWSQFSRNANSGCDWQLGIKSDGTMWAWGQNANGQLGVGGFVLRSSPTQVGTANNWSQVTICGASKTSLAIDTSGNLWGWGASGNGQIPGGTTAGKSWVVQVGGQSDVPIRCYDDVSGGQYPWIDIDGGYDHVVGRTASTDIRVWGLNDFGQLGLNDRIARSAPTQVLGNRPSIQISAGTYNTGFVDSFGRANTMGINDSGVLGFGPIGIYRSSPVQAGTLSGFTSIAAGEFYFVALKSTGTLWAWGDNGYGQLGQQDSTTRSWPTQVGTFPSTLSNLSFTSIATGYQTVTAIDSTGKLFMWGRNTEGQLGTGDTITKSFPIQIAGYTDAVTKGYGAFFKKSDGTWYGSGTNTSGELGTGDTIRRSSPVQAMAGTTTQIFSRSSPTQIGTNSWVQVSAGTNNTFGITSSNELIGWGNNLTGKIGTPDTVGYSWKAMAMGSHTVGIRSDNTLWSWGFNGNGQLGIGNTITRSSPVQVGTDANWSQITVGGSHTMAIKTTGSLWAWGYNQFSQINNLSYTSIDAGTDYAMLIRSDGRLLTFGSADAIKTTVSTSRSTPTQVGQINTATIKKIAVGDINSFAIDNVGMLYSTGDMKTGMLGSLPNRWPSAGSQYGLGAQSAWYAVPMNLFDNTPLLDVVTSSRQAYFIDILYRVWAVGNAEFGDGNDTAIKRLVPELLGSTRTAKSYSLLKSDVYHDPNGWSFPIFPADNSIYSQFSFTGAFTIEAWIFRTDSGETSLTFGTYYGDLTINIGTSSNGGYWDSLYGSITISGVPYGGSFTAGPGPTGSPELVPYTWTHIAFVRTSTGIIYGYMGGVRQPVSFTGAVGTVDNVTDARWLATSGYDRVFSGFISNFRITKAQVYTGATYTLPTGGFSATQSANPFGGSGTAAITGTQCSLLTYQDATAIDNSTFALAPIYGSPAPGQDVLMMMTNFSPFASSITLPATNTSYTQLAAGWGHTLGIQTNSTLWTWGLNTSGQLGLNDTINRSSPIQIGTSSWSMITAGLYHSAGITVDNKLFIWGNNEFGQLGLNDKIFRSNPVQITSPAVSWTMVKTKYYHTVATASTNYTYGWGNNIFQQLGPNAGTISYSQISSGIVRTNTGEALGWGLNWELRFGIARPFTTTNLTSSGWSYPVQIQTSRTDMSWSYVNSTAYIPNNYWGKTMFIRTDGTLWGVGKNAYGDLGTGDTIARSSPTQIGSDTNWSSVVSNFNRATFAIKTDGTLWAWGYDQSIGLLGTNDLVNRSSPVQISGSWSLVSGGMAHTLGIKSDGTLWSWGQNNNGQLGTDNRVNRSGPVQITPGTSYLHASAGLSYSLAVPTDGTLSAWGNNSVGQLGLNDTTARSSPTQVSATTGWTKVSASYILNSLGLNGTSIYAWGFNTNGELGVGDVVARSSPTLVSGGHTWIDLNAESIGGAIRSDHTVWTWGVATRIGTGPLVGNRSNPVQILNNNTINVLSPILITTSPVSAITTGYNTTHLLYPNGNLESLGYNAYGQLGVNDTVGRSSPTQIYTTDINTVSRSLPVQLGSSSWSVVSAGASHSIGITTNGTLWGWGGNSNGQLGDGTTLSKIYMVAAGSSSWTTVTAGNNFNMGLIGSALYNWGQNSGGQLGIDTTTGRSSPVQISGSYTSISAGASTAYAINTNNVLLAWGIGTSGQLGDSTTVSRSSPIQVGSYTQVLAGAQHVLAKAATTNILFGWGLNNSYQLGDGTIVSRSSPTQLPGSYNILGAGPAALSSALDASIGVVMGSNTQGNLGTNNTNSGTSPTLIFTGALTTGAYPAFYVAPVRMGLSSWSQIFAGSSHTIAIKTDNTLWAWGLGTSGQLGNTATTSRSSPVQVSIASTTVFTKISLGGSHTTALSNTAALWIWGLNSSGQLGLNTTTNRSSPVQVSGVYSTTSAGETHTVALTSDGTLYAWGQNSVNQLGNADTINRSSPVQIATNSLTTNAIYREISSSLNNSVALNMTGDILGWGNSTFVTGSSPIVISASDAVNYTVSSPVQIGTSSWSQVSAGDNSSIGLQADGTVDTWGLNNYGQLGLNDTLNRSSPVQIGSDTYSNVSAGYDFNALRKSDGKTYLFGKNDAGQVGDLT